jgi:hypothetical protein
MSHNAEYKNKFVPGALRVEITPSLILKSITDRPLRLNSYVNPQHVVLVVVDNIYEDIVFNGIVDIEADDVEYANITCRHITFSGMSICVLSKINAVSINADNADDILYSFNENVVSFIGPVDNTEDYFPNLIIRSKYCKTNGNELMSYSSGKNGSHIMLNLNHEYYSVIMNSGLIKEAYDCFGTTSYHSLYGKIDTHDYEFAEFLLSIIDIINENPTPLKKNAYK